jgi:hypothetical protein
MWVPVTKSSNQENIELVTESYSGLQNWTGSLQTDETKKWRLGIEPGVLGFCVQQVH